jgi:hypothetical protein
MTAAAWAALAITIFGAFSYGAGSILQAVGARRSTGTVRTLGHPLYLIGVGCDLLAWAGSMIALRELAVYLVQSVLAGSLAVTVVAARLLLASRLRGRDVAAVTVTIGALTILAMSAGPQEQVTASGGLRLGFCVAAVATALLGWGVARSGSPGIAAALAGLAFGGAALAGRALIMPADPMAHMSATALAVLTEPLTAALLIFAATGMLLYTNALQNGQVGPVTAVLWIGEVIAPSAVALTVLGDTVRPGWELAATIAGLVTVAMAVLLATAPANDATALPADAQADGLRPPIPVGGRRPAALPSGANQWGTILWFGSPTNPLPIWRPPDRTAAARAARAAPQPIADRPWANPQPISDRPWTDPQPVAAGQFASQHVATQQSGGQQSGGQQSSGQQPSGQQLAGQQLAGQRGGAQQSEAPHRIANRPPVTPGYPIHPELSQQRQADPQPHDPEFGTVTWWGEPTSPQPIWRPPDRPKSPEKPPTAAKPSPHRTPPTWREPPGRRST